MGGDFLPELPFNSGLSLERVQETVQWSGADPGFFEGGGGGGGGGLMVMRSRMAMARERVHARESMEAFAVQIYILQNFAPFHA